MAIARVLAVSAVFVLAACAGVTPAGRNAPIAEPAPPPPVEAAEPAPPAPVVQAPPTRAAAEPAEETPAVSPPRRGEDEVVIPGQISRQVPAPNGDPRTPAERMQDIRAWDRCVTHAQAALDADPMRPQLDTPEDTCNQSLGMSGRTSVPNSRR